MRIVVHVPILRWPRQGRLWKGKGLSIINCVSDFDRRLASLEARVRLIEKSLRPANSSDSDEYRPRDQVKDFGSSGVAASRGEQTAGGTAPISSGLPSETPKEARLTLASSVLGLSGSEARERAN